MHPRIKPKLGLKLRMGRGMPQIAPTKKVKVGSGSITIIEHSWPSGVPKSRIGTLNCNSLCTLILGSYEAVKWTPYTNEDL